jgi:hypothetical protein
MGEGLTLQKQTSLVEKRTSLLVAFTRQTEIWKTLAQTATGIPASKALVPAF